MYEEEPRARAASGSKRLAFPPFLGLAAGGVTGALIEAATHREGLLSELAYFVMAALGGVVGFVLGAFVGILLYITRPR